MATLCLLSFPSPLRLRLETHREMKLLSPSPFLAVGNGIRPPSEWGRAPEDPTPSLRSDPPYQVIPVAETRPFLRPIPYS